MFEIFGLCRDPAKLVPEALCGRVFAGRDAAYQEKDHFRNLPDLLDMAQLPDIQRRTCKFH